MVTAIVVHVVIIFLNFARVAIHVKNNLICVHANIACELSGLNIIVKFVIRYMTKIAMKNILYFIHRAYRVRIVVFFANIREKNSANANAVAFV